MDKWDLIKLISEKDLLLKLLDWADVNSTREITQQQAEDFYKNYVKDNRNGLYYSRRSCIFGSGRFGVAESIVGCR